MSAYHGLGVVHHTDWVDDYTSTAADEYLVGSGIPDTNVATLARGGEVVQERPCSLANPDCVFHDYPGSVGWKYGLLAMRNAPVNDSGGELNNNVADLTNWLNGSQHRLRFDRERRPYFHYGLGAHTRGTGILPCLTNPGGNPTGYFQPGICGDPSDPITPNQANPEFTNHQVPSSAGGIADLPGRNFMATHGLWDELVGRPYAREVTIFHELGHNLYLWHGGLPADFGDVDEDTVIAANCKPNLITSMNYLYEHYGLFDQFGNIQLDFSQGALPVLEEDALADGTSLTSPPYKRAWYAPFYKLDAFGNPVDGNPNLPGVQKVISPLVDRLGIASPSTKLCGRKFGDGEPSTEMVRVTSELPFSQNGWKIDWDADDVDDTPTFPAQDVNFDGKKDADNLYSDSFTGYNDWANIRLDQISAGGLTSGFEDIVFLDDTFVGIGGDDEFAGIGGDDSYVGIGGDDGYIGIGGDDGYINIGGDDGYINIGGDDDFTGIGGDDEPGYKSGDPTAPYEVSACIVGDTCFQNQQPFTPDTTGLP